MVHKLTMAGGVMLVVAMLIEDFRKGGGHLHVILSTEDWQETKYDRHELDQLASRLAQSCLFF